LERKDQIVFTLLPMEKPVKVFVRVAESIEGGLNLTKMENP
jgi:hypothetical protein